MADKENTGTSVSAAKRHAVIAAMTIVAAAAAGATLYFTREYFVTKRYEVFLPEDVRCDTDGFPFRGSPSAPVQLIAYSDFECKWTPEMDMVLDTLLSTVGVDRIQICYKPRPLFRSPVRRLRTRAIFAAMDQGKFFEMRRLLMDITVSEDESVRERKLRADIMKCAEEAGLDLEKFRRDMGSEAVGTRIEEVIAETDKYGITRYPATLIEGVLLTGVRSAAQYRRILAPHLPELSTPTDTAQQAAS
jgi:protein-disulfide isomerase